MVPDNLINFILFIDRPYKLCDGLLSMLFRDVSNGRNTALALITWLYDGVTSMTNNTV